MRELKVILREIDRYIAAYKKPPMGMEVEGTVDLLEKCRSVICKYMGGKDSNVPANDVWIPIEKKLPPFGKRLQATILHHEWISDYDADWVSEEEKTYHPAYTEVCEIYPMGGLWFYNCAEDDYERDVAYINPIQDLANPVSEIIAWRPFPKPYQAKT